MKKILGVLFLTLIFGFFVPSVLADEVKQVSIVNPIRGKDFWQNNYSLVDVPKKQYQIISANRLPATWLLRYDALQDPEVVAFLKSLDSKQELGLFFEITPSLTKAAGVSYNSSPNWHWARSVLLVGYSPEDRKKLIDTAVTEFQKVTGKSLKSVGAWWIDADSLVYLKQKYGIEANLDVADQYSTDQYQIWGQYFSLPFYPSHQNALMPAQNAGNKIGVVTTQWAARDPLNAYGNGVLDSTYSVQVNDYLLHDLGIDYFKKLLSFYPQMTVGLENDFNFDKFGGEYNRQIQVLIEGMKQGQILIKTMSEYAKYYSLTYPDISPPVLIQANDPLGGFSKVVWYQSPVYRVGWFYGKYGSAIRDLRIYDDSSQEPCLKKACDQLNLATSFINAIDDVTYANAWKLDQGNISDFSVNQVGEEIHIGYKNQAGVVRDLVFMPRDIKFNNKSYTLASAVMQASLQKEQPPQALVSSDQFKLKSDKIIPNLLTDFLKFIVLTLLFFFLPGWVLTKRFFLSVPVGWMMFTLVVFLLSLIKLNWLVWVLPVVSISLMIKQREYPKLPTLRNISPIQIGLMGLVLVGSLSWLLTVVRSGLPYLYGYGFWGPNGHDAIWHLALIGQLKEQVPPVNPIFSGVVLTNYHYFFDLLLARSSQLFGLDAQDLLFRFFPLLISIFSGILLYKVVIKIFNNQAIGLLSLFFLYFGGSFGWIVSLLRNGTIGGESTFWAQQSISTLLNPPFAISVVILLAGFYLLADYLENNKKSDLIALVLLWGTLIEFKVYAGVLVLGGLFILTVWRILRNRDFGLLIVFLPILILALAVFLPNNIGSSSLLILSPLWLVNSMIDIADRLGWPRLALAHQSAGVKYFIVEVVGFVLFFIGNLGTRIVMLLSLRKKTESSPNNLIKVLLWLVIILGLVIPLVFIQKGNSWNIVQFFYYSLIVADIFAAASVYYLIKNKNRVVQIVAVLLLVVFTLPTSLDTVSQYLPNRPPSMLPNSEIEALSFLKNQPQGAVLSIVDDKTIIFNYKEPKPLYSYTSTAYIPAFSNHPAFMADTTNLEILNISYEGRLNEQNDFFRGTDQSKQVLRRNNIAYIYVVKVFNFQADEAKMGIKKIFENNDVKIYKVF